MAAPTTLQNIEVVKIPEGFLRHPAFVDEIVLLAGAAQTFPVPIVPASGQHAHFAIFSADCDFRVGYDQTAAIAGNSVFDGSACELNPDQRYVLGVTNLSLISPTGGHVTVSFYTS